MKSQPVPELGIDPYIETFTGKKFYPLKPTSDALSIKDIAHALSMKCRYTGHCNFFYSVAQHSVLMANAFIASNCDGPVTRATKMIAFDMLMHDIGEAYLPDVAKPIKPYFLELQKMEEKIIALAAVKYGFRHPMPSVVKEWDTGMLKLEAETLMKSRGDSWAWPDDVIDLRFKVDILSWPPAMAEKRFLALYEQITGSKGD